MPTELQKFKQALDDIDMYIDFGEVQQIKSRLLGMFQSVYEDFKLFQDKIFQADLKTFQKLEERLIQEDYEDMLLVVHDAIQVLKSKIIK